MEGGNENIVRVCGGIGRDLSKRGRGKRNRQIQPHQKVQFQSRGKIIGYLGKGEVT